MGPLSKYGVVLAPSSAVKSLAMGWLNAWSYDYSSPAHVAAEASLNLRNACDDVLGKYLTELRGKLHLLRSQLPEPTRENPFPPADGLAAVKEMDAYVHQVEALRVKVQSLPIPPRDWVMESQSAHTLNLQDLETVDRQILSALAEVDETSLRFVEDLILRREHLLTSSH